MSDFRSQPMIETVADRLEFAKPGWLPISGHVVNFTFSLAERDEAVKALRDSASLKARIQELTTALELAEYVSRKDSLTEYERLESARTVICHALPPKSAK
jgi:hypothetical protein